MKDFFSGESYWNFFDHDEDGCAVVPEINPVSINNEPARESELLQADNNELERKPVAA